MLEAVIIYGSFCPKLKRIQENRFPQVKFDHEGGLKYTCTDNNMCPGKEAVGGAIKKVGKQ